MLQQMLQKRSSQFNQVSNVKLGDGLAEDSTEEEEEEEEEEVQYAEGFEARESVRQALLHGLQSCGC